MNPILSNRANKIWMQNITGVTKYCSRETELKTVMNQKPKKRVQKFICLEMVEEYLGLNVNFCQ
jgi:hypothetical protein